MPESIAFGQVARRLRQEMPGRVTQGEVGAMVTVGRVYISQVEAGSTLCRGDFAARLGKALEGITDEENDGTQTELYKAWVEYIKPLKDRKKESQAGLLVTYRNYPRFEYTSSQVRSFCSMIVGGLFQTREYASHIVPDEKVLEARVARQAIFHQTPRPMISTIIKEDALYNCVGPPDVMCGQMDHLVDVSERGLAVVQILPKWAHLAELRGDFDIATKADGRQMAYITHQVGGLTTTDPHQVESCTALYAQMQGKALNVADSLAFLRKVRKEHESR
ncbi:DUF5753 domain-containing protein [Actinomadura flavalba]|uniref:DUF5753 domain-containing protein n=1 Tax=Actinomadura flavalba TaxID=1120938 RepID=UPI0012DF7492|nr:DUF5753 domain-containing protein [Actinomadura flavalba]